MRSVRLIRKLAASLNGFNLSHICVGDVLELPEQTASMLIAEGWAEPLAKGPTTRADDQFRPPPSSTKRKRR